MGFGMIGGPRTGLPLNEQELRSVQWRRDAIRLNPRNLCADPAAAAGELLATIDRLLATIESRDQRIGELEELMAENIELLHRLQGVPGGSYG